MKQYILIYQTETDGEIKIEYMFPEEIGEKVKDMHYLDYAIVEGNILKTFDNKPLQYWNTITKSKGK